MIYREVKLSRNIRIFLTDLVMIILGTILMAVGIDLFLVPSKLSTGGFSGIGTVLYYFLNLPVGNTTLLLNIPLFIFAFFRIGKKFVVRTVLGTTLLSFFLNTFQKISPFTDDKVLAFIYGSILMGIGTAIVLKAKASTGGTELLASIIKSYKPRYRTGGLITVLDATIVGINVLFFKDIEVALYSGLAIFVMGKVLDIFFEGIDFSKMLLIISEEAEIISERINKELSRGTTLLNGLGMYKKEERKILLCVLSRNEVRTVMEIVEELDKSAFTIITNAREVYGKGFKRQGT